MKKGTEIYIHLHTLQCVIINYVRNDVTIHMVD